MSFYMKSKRKPSQSVEAICTCLLRFFYFTILFSYYLTWWKKKKYEEHRHAKHNKIYYGYFKSIDQYMIGSEEEVTKAVEGKAILVDDYFMHGTHSNYFT